MKTVIVTFGILSAGPAFAGALGEVVDGLRRASDDGKDDRDHGGGGSSDEGSSSREESRHSDWDDLGTTGGGTGTSSASAVAVDWGSESPPPQAGPGVHVHLYLAGQSVADSNGSLTMEARAWYEDFGLGVRQTSFFEEAEPKWLRLDLWTLSAHYRAHTSDRSELWLEGGLGGFRTIDDLTSLGPQGGLRVEHQLTDSFGITAEGRGYFLENDVRALELRAALRVSILYLAYRIVDFNVGPPLHGPEVGLGYTF